MSWRSFYNGNAATGLANQHAAVAEGFVPLIVFCMTSVNLTQSMRAKDKIRHSPTVAGGDTRLAIFQYSCDG